MASGLVYMTSTVLGAQASHSLDVGALSPNRSAQCLVMLGGGANDGRQSNSVLGNRQIQNLEMHRIILGT